MFGSGSALYNTVGAQIVGGNTGVYVAGTGTVTNAGTIAAGASFSSGVYLFGAGSLTNLAGGLITGHYGVYGEYGATVVNSGAITGTASGVNFRNSGTLTNNANATIYGGYAGVRVQFGDNAITNAGTIVGGSIGIQISNATAAINNSGLVTGGVRGIYLRGSDTVTNSGLITGGDQGIDVVNSAVITNSGTIFGTGTAGVGVLSANSADTLINSGTIIGNSGTAVRFGAGNDLLVLGTGFSFGGEIVDGGAGVNTLAVAQNATLTNGALSNAGSYANFLNFTAYGAAAGVTLTNVGTTTTPITLAGDGSTLLNTTGAKISTQNYVNSVVVLANGTVNNAGTISAVGAPGVSLTNGGLVSNTGAIISVLSGEGYSAGIRLSNGGTIINSVGGQIVGGSVGVQFASSTPATLVNSGTITGG